MGDKAARMNGNGRDRELDELLSQYGASIQEAEASANFMPGIWARIENRREGRYRLIHLSRLFVSGAAAVWLLIAGVQFVPDWEPKAQQQGYVDALAASRENAVLTFAESMHVELGEPDSR